MRYNARAMWKHNKVGILSLLIGGALLFGAYAYYLPQDEILAERILGTGMCILLFVVGLGSFLSVRWK